MHNKSYKKAVVFAICLTMLMPLGSMVVSSTDESSSQADSSAAVKDTDSSVDSAADDTSSADASDAAATADEAAIKLLKTQQPMRKQLLQQARTTRFSL